MSTDKFSDITTGSRQITGSDRTKDMTKIYECNNCGQEENNRKDIREHVKQCQPHWKADRPAKAPQASPKPLSSRYSSRRTAESEK